MRTEPHIASLLPAQLTRIVLVHFGLILLGLYHLRQKAAQMEKSIYTEEYAVLLELLREARVAAGLTQVELAARLGQSQSFVTKAEGGDRRLDVIQFRTICRTLGTSFPAFAAKLEERLASKKKRKK